MAELINIDIDKESLKELFNHRVHFWHGKIAHDADQFFCDYYANLIDNDYFSDGAKVDIPMIVDNDIINDLEVVDEYELVNDWGIDPNDEEKILFADDGLFMISARG